MAAGTIETFSVGESKGFIRRDGQSVIPFTLAQVVGLSAAQIAGLSITDGTAGGFRLPGHACTFCPTLASGGDLIATHVCLDSARDVWS